MPQDLRAPGLTLAPLAQDILQGLASHGLPLADFLAEHKAQLDTANPPGWVPDRLIEAALVRALEQRADPVLGLRGAREVQFPSLGLAGYIAQNAATLGELIRLIIRYESLITTEQRLSLERRPGKVYVCWNPRGFTEEATRRHGAEFILAGWIRLCQLLLPRHENPLEEVHFQHAAPCDKRLLRVYQQVLRAPVYFEQDSNALVLRAPSLDTPLRHGNPQILAMLEQHARHHLEARGDPQQTLTSQTRTLLMALLRKGGASRDRVAAQLGVSGRTLHRQLLQEGTNYQELLNQLRLELAQDALRQSRQSLDDIAQQLGFADGQSFTRWFRRQMGLAPGAYRRQHSA